MLTGKKVRLRAWEESDAEKAYALVASGSVRETLIEGPLFPLSLAAERAWVLSQSAASGLNPEGVFNFAIEDLTTGELAGGCGINKNDSKNSVVGVGLFLGGSFQGRGLGSDTLRALCRFVFDELNRRRIELRYFDFNEQGRRCYDAVGFVEEGRLRQALFRHGTYHDIVIMGLFRSELRD